MLDFSKISEDLFSKINGRFSSVTIGDQEGTIINEPDNARFFDFTYEDSGVELGKVSISLNDSKDTGSLVLIFSKDFIKNENELTQSNWYNFLKELRTFAKKRLLNFEIRDITKSNLQKKDYRYLSQKVNGDGTMNESKLYGTGKISYQDFGNSRIMIKHTENINTEIASGRTQKIGKIYIESSEGERFKYPYKHLSGARAMARHVAEGGKPYDDFGKHITGLSEELAKLRKFKTYMGRSAVMAESLSEYVDVVKERIATVKKTVESLQKPNFYKEAVEGFEAPVFEDVPDDVKENWIDQLTIKQFNEELKDVFPYVYRLISEVTKAKELTPENIVDEAGINPMAFKPSEPTDDDMYLVQKGDTVFDLSRRSGTPVEDIIEINGLDDKGTIRVGQELIVPGINQIGASPTTPGATRGIDPKDNYSKDDFDKLVNQSKYEDQLEAEFEEMMGQFSEKETEGNAYAHAVRKAKMDGKKKGDKVKGPDGDEITIEKDEKTPLGEFILSYFDRETGQFPKGETAVLTMVEKDYGEEFIEPAKAFIEQINNKVAEVMGYAEANDITAKVTSKLDYDSDGDERHVRTLSKTDNKTGRTSHSYKRQTTDKDGNTSSTDSYVDDRGNVYTDTSDKKGNRTSTSGFERPLTKVRRVSDSVDRIKGLAGIK